MVIEQRTAGRSISTVSICLKAAPIAYDMKISDFLVLLFHEKVSSLHLHKNYHLTAPRSAGHLRLLRKRSLKIRSSKTTSPHHIPLTSDIPVNHNVKKTGTSMMSTYTTRKEKSSFVAVLGCQANGQKLPPIVVFRRKTLPKEKFAAEIIIKVIPKGWMDEEKIRVAERSSSTHYHLY